LISLVIYYAFLLVFLDDAFLALDFLVIVFLAEAFFGDEPSDLRAAFFKGSFFALAFREFHPFFSAGGLAGS
jgi:hypothetical protein